MKERVQILGGDIEVDSEPGRGTCIRISFPVTASLRAPPRKTRV
jgi:chemotaxis protein histidine kinase CheA